MGNGNIQIKPKVLIDEEILDKDQHREKVFICKITPNSIIKYVDDAFVEVSGFSKAELIGENLIMLDYDKTPQSILNILLKSVENEKSFYAVFKNVAKDGRYYWVVTRRVIDKDDLGNITGYTYRRRLAPTALVQKFEPLYKTLVELEEVKGVQIAQSYLESYIREKDEDYDNFFDSYNRFVKNLFEQGFREDSKKYRKEKINDAITKFFISDYS